MGSCYSIITIPLYSTIYLSIHVYRIRILFLNDSLGDFLLLAKSVLLRVLREICALSVKKLGTIIFTHFAWEIGVRLAKINALAHALQLTAVLCHHDGLYLECSTVVF